MFVPLAHNKINYKIIMDTKMKDIYNTEFELGTSTFNVSYFVGLEKNRAITKSTCDHIVFYCGNNFFSSIISHPNTVCFYRKKQQMFIIELRNLLKSYKINIEKIKDFIFINEILFVLEYDTKIDTEEAIFENEEYISILKNIT